MLRDLYHNYLAKLLSGPAAITGDTNSDYIDTAGLIGVGFEVICFPSVADGSNFITPILYGTNSATPGTASEYTAVTADEIDGGLFTAVKATTAGNVQFRSLKEHKYRYYYVWLDETLTAAGVYGVVAYAEGAVKPSTGLTITTGTVT